MNDIHSFNPGPGAYSPKIDVIKFKVLTFEFGKCTNDSQTQRDFSPGPGAYDNRKEFGSDAIKVSIKGRP